MGLKFTMLGYKLAASMFGFGMLLPLVPAVADDKPAVPISRDASNYPAAAGTQSGTVDLSFTIDATGHVTDARVIGSSLPGVFDQTALATVAEWTYQPRELDGKNVAQTGNRIRLDFEPPTDAPVELTAIVPTDPLYTMAAYRAHQEGDVTLSFDVDQLGQPENVRVVSATNPGWFDESAVDSVKATLFKPAMERGAPQEIDGLTTTLQFRLATAKIAPTIIGWAPSYHAYNGLKEGLEGNAIVQAVIDPSGAVKSTKVILSYPTVTAGEAAESDVQQMRFAPVDPELAAHTEMTIYQPISYEIQSNKDQVHYALKPHQWVRLSYTLSSSGHTSDIKLVAISSPDVNSEAAIDQLHDTVLAPVTVNGVAVTVPNQQTTIEGPTEADYANSDQR